MNRYLIVLTVLVSGFAFSCAPLGNKPKTMNDIEKGRYIVATSGCNDCHTPGYAESGGNVPEEKWLVGDILGWFGPWGTTYPVNLRLYMQNLSETAWVEKAKNLQTRPPMPWFSLNRMSEDDLRSVYRFVRSLEPSGEPAPPYLPAGQEPKQPYVQFPMPPPMSAQ